MHVIVFDPTHHPFRHSCRTALKCCVDDNVNKRVELRTRNCPRGPNERRCHWCCSTNPVQKALARRVKLGTNISPDVAISGCGHSMRHSKLSRRWTFGPKHALIGPSRLADDMGYHFKQVSCILKHGIGQQSPRTYVVMSRRIIGSSFTKLCGEPGDRGWRGDLAKRVAAAQAPNKTNQNGRGQNQPME